MIVTLFILSTLQTRGINYLDGSARCPLAGVGTRGDNACTRIALDDDNSHVSVDGHRIRWRNDKKYDSETTIGDLLVLGYKTTATGKTPIAVHVIIRKKGNRFEAKPHAHATNREKATAFELESYELILIDGTTQTVALDEATAKRAVADPGLAAKLANQLVELSSSGPGDLTVGIGIGRAAKDVVHAQLKGTLAQGDFELRITSLSSLLPKEVVRRDLFLYGVEDQAVLASVKTDGLAKGQTLVFAMHDGKGTIALGDKSAPLPQVVDSARAFLEFSFLGAILAK